MGWLSAGLHRSRKWNSPEKRPQRCLAAWEGGSTFLARRRVKVMNNIKLIYDFKKKKKILPAIQNSSPFLMLSLLQNQMTPSSSLLRKSSESIFAVLSSHVDLCPVRSPPEKAKKKKKKIKWSRKKKGR